MDIDGQDSTIDPCKKAKNYSGDGNFENDGSDDNIEVVLGGDKARTTQTAKQH